jgi:hypothetical protein
VRCAIWRARSVVAESVLVKHQLLILNRSRNVDNFDERCDSFEKRVAAFRRT